MCYCSVRLNFDAKSEDVKADWHHGSLWQLVVLPVLPYLLWAIAYYVKVSAALLYATQF